jgi:hypothetical protein
MQRDIQDQERAILGISRSIGEIQAEMKDRLCVTPHHGHIGPMRAQLGWLEEAVFKSVDSFGSTLTWQFSVASGKRNAQHDGVRGPMKSAAHDQIHFTATEAQTLYQTRGPRFCSLMCSL